MKKRPKGMDSESKSVVREPNLKAENSENGEAKSRSF